MSSLEDPRVLFAAVRTLTANLTRLSRESLGAASRRTDLARLARLFHEAVDADEAHVLADAAFGLGSCRHLGRIADDAADPASSITPWREAPRAVVPLALRARGEVSQRGRTTPIRDRSRERELLERARQLERVEAERLRAELLAAAGPGGELDDVHISVAAFALLRDAIGRARIGGGTAGFGCEVRPTPGRDSSVHCDDGTLILRDLVVALSTGQGVA